MPFARSCGSSTTSSGPRTAPNVIWTPLKTSYQCAIGCELKTSSRIAVSCGMFCISLAGSVNRGSVKRSSRPTAFARTANLSGVTMSTNQAPSEARDVRVDQTRIPGDQVVVFEFQPLAGGMRRVDDEHVGPFHQPLDNLLSAR